MTKKIAHIQYFNHGTARNFSLKHAESKFQLLFKSIVKNIKCLHVSRILQFNCVRIYLCLYCVPTSNCEQAGCPKSYLKSTVSNSNNVFTNLNNIKQGGVFFHNDFTSGAKQPPCFMCLKSSVKRY